MVPLERVIDPMIEINQVSFTAGMLFSVSHQEDMSLNEKNSFSSGEELEEPEPETLEPEGDLNEENDDLEMEDSTNHPSSKNIHERNPET
jgi:hypothetical protein